MIRSEGTDYYPIKNALAWVRKMFAREDYGARVFAASLAIPYMSNPFKGIRVITQGFSSTHRGVDYGMAIRTPLYAAHYGQVVIARKDNTGYGYVIAIKDDARGLYSVYGHLDGQTAIVVRVGQWVQEREHIGFSGNTGNSTGPHLHFELRVPPYGYGGNCVNPLPYLKVWNDAPTPTPPPPEPTSNRYRTLSKVKLIKKNTGKVVGQFAAGVTLELGSVTSDGRHYYCPAQLGQPAGFVPVGKVIRV